MTKRNMLISAALGALASVALVAGAAAQGTAPAPPTDGTLLSLTQIEQLLKDKGVRVTEIEVKDKIVEAEGYDSQNREVELVVDRRTGEILEERLGD